jgi:methionyl-tRNA formyltransferase
MRVVFLGSPAAALLPLQQLAAQGSARGHQLVGVVSQPARPVGRGQTLEDPPVAAWAKTQPELAVLQPERASDPVFLEALAALAPDVAITAAYGQILTEAFLKIPRRATINIHPSLLPRYRGATPVPAALLAGDEVSGVTILFTVKALDAGAVILQKSSPVGPEETAGEMTERLFAEGGELLFDALDLLVDPKFVGTPQDPSAVTHCRKIAKTDGALDFTLPARRLFDRWRAFEPWPGSYTFCQGRRIAVVEAKLRERDGRDLAPGAARYDKPTKTILVGTGEGALGFVQLKPAGGKAVPADAFWNGQRDKTNVQFSATDAAP